ncbi:nucleotidyltransferase family protein [Paenibacillus fonticola]|uniref:nucleotidyltransferase family protein n=1 Tax=Paenibacillus fonticola TaxID=379896 RepID=UPI000360E116|nr:nucleotidyltransferase domain-containing protein [Paenibacillus fonticola]
MSVGGISPATFERIIFTVKKYPGIRKLFLFGSRARGDYSYNSDIDLAYEADSDVPSIFFVELDEAVGIYSFNLVNLAECSKHFREEISSDLQMIYNKEKEDTPKN